MYFSNTKIIIFIAGVGLLILAVFGWFLFLRPSPGETTSSPGFGIGDNRSVVVTTETSPSDEVGDVGQQASEQLVFKIADGPVAGATFIETTRPTTTVARYVKQENGHVFDQPIDVPGSVARAVSNTTIPGVVRAEWVKQGNGVIVQYLNDEVVKSVYLGFPAATTTATSTRPVKIQFLPDNIRGLAAAPGGERVVYLLQTQNGTVGYLANADGGGSVQLFSSPLSQLLLSWPAESTLLLTTKSAAGAPGIAFSVDAKTGAVSPLIYAAGLTATANAAFTRVIYQASPAGAATPSTYSRNVAEGSDTPLSFDPYPEKCVWSALATSTMYCASPLEYVPINYLDLWHLGAASVADSVFSFDVSLGRSSVIATPGSGDGGTQADIEELSISPSERYLMYTSRNGNTLWGVRLH